jgi:beta-1,4-mannosyltransferase
MAKQHAFGSAHRPRIGYWPFESGANAYAKRMRDILGSFGDVSGFPTSVRLFPARPRSRRFDVAIINWLEVKVVNAKGRPSLRSLCKLFIQTLLFRIQARRLILVRHNRYPHHTQQRYAWFVTKCLDLYERLYDQTVTHSKAEETPSRSYCPHPLYTAADDRSGRLPQNVDLAPGYFVVLGRFERYKCLEELIHHFPERQRLLIVGDPVDSAYAEELCTLRRPNVRVEPGFLPNELARKVVARSCAMILGHAGDDMVVSGSFFFALSVGKPVFAVETPFIRWAQSALDERSVVSAADLSALCEKIRGFRPPFSATAPVPSPRARAAFGDECVRQHLERVLFDRC